MATIKYSFPQESRDITIKAKITWDPRDVLAHGDGFVILRSAHYNKDLDYAYTITNLAAKKKGP